VHLLKIRREKHKHTNTGSEMSLNATTPMQGSIAQRTKVSGGEMDVLTALGQQLELSPELLAQNPELAKLVGENPGDLDFKTLLGESEGKTGEVDPELLAKAKNALGELDEKALEIGKQVKSQTPNQSSILGNPSGTAERALSPYEVSRNNEEKALNSVKSIFTKPQAFADSTKVQSIEDASRAFVPERKSMLDVNKRTAESKPTEATKGLMNLNEFIENQSSNKKQAIVNANSNPYKAAEAKSMFAKNIEADAPKMTQVQTAETPPMKISDLMLQSESGTNSESGLDSNSGQHNNTTKIASTLAAGKTFDLAMLANTNQTDVIAKIQDYIVQSRASSDPSMQMSFEHKDLGMVDLTVAKDGNQVSVMINSHTKEGSKFFTQNQGELLQSLSKAGVSVSEFKLDTSSNTNSNQNNSSDSFNNQNGKQEHAGSERGQRDRESQRREELWDLMNNKEAA
jgi:flagellar hook-length control protein FliK